MGYQEGTGEDRTGHGVAFLLYDPDLCWHIALNISEMKMIGHCV